MSYKGEINKRNKEIYRHTAGVGVRSVVRTRGDEQEVIFQPPVACYLSPSLLFYSHRDNGLQHKLFILLHVHAEELLVMGKK